MSSRPYMKFFLGDFAGDTLQLSATEIGAYVLLLTALWTSKDDCLPNDDKLLRRITRIHDLRVWKRVKPIVLRFFQVSDDGSRLSNARVTIERQFVNKVRTQNSAKALKRWNRGNAAAGSHSHTKEEDLNESSSLVGAGSRARFAKGAPRAPRAAAQMTIEELQKLYDRMSEPGVWPTKEQAQLIEEALKNGTIH